MSLQDELMEAGILTPESLKLLEANAERGLAEEAEEKRRAAEQERKFAERQERLAERKTQTANRAQQRAERERKRDKRERKEAERAARLKKQKKIAAENFDPAARIDRCMKSNRPIVVEMQNLTSVEIAWLWPNRIPRGKLTLFSGDPGLGKSYVALDVAARVSSGSEWPGEEGGSGEEGAGRKEMFSRDSKCSGEERKEAEKELAPLSIGTCADIENAENTLPVQAPMLSNELHSAGVLILSGDDQAEDMMMPRLERLGVNRKRIRFLTGVEINGQQEDFTFPRDAAALEIAIREMPDCKLVIIDPISTFFSTMGTGSLAKVRAAFNPLKAVAERTKVAIILINHLNKSSGNPLHRSAGSISIIGLARTAWAFARCNDDHSRCVMVPLKNNLGPDSEALSYSISDSGLAWDDEPFNLSAADAFGSQEKIRSRNPHAIHEAMQWLQGVFEVNQKPIAQTFIESTGAEMGISYTTLKRAKVKLGIVTKVEKVGGPWYWSVPNSKTTLVQTIVESPSGP